MYRIEFSWVSLLLIGSAMSLEGPVGWLGWLILIFHIVLFIYFIWYLYTWWREQTDIND